MMFRHSIFLVEPPSFSSINFVEVAVHMECSANYKDTIGDEMKWELNHDI